MAQQELGYADEYMMQMRQSSDSAFDMVFAFKEKINDRLLISTGDIVRVQKGATPDFYLDDIDLNQCAYIQLGAVDSKVSNIVLVFQTSFDCDLFVRSVEAIRTMSMFDATLTPVPLLHRALIDKCSAQKSENIGWGDRQLVLIPLKLLIYSAEKSASSAAPRFPRNVIIHLHPRIVVSTLHKFFLYFADYFVKGRPSEPIWQGSSRNNHNRQACNLLIKIQVCERASGLGKACAALCVFFQLTFFV